jgi:hypothetical protein
MFSNKISLMASIFVATVFISACQPQKSIQSDEHIEEVKAEEKNIELKGVIEKLNLNLPKCEDKNCPELSIERLSSNQFFVDQVIDSHIVEIFKQILDPEDLKDSMVQVENTASEINQENGLETAKQRLENQLIPYVQSFLQLDQEVKGLSVNHQISFMIKPKILNSTGPLATVVLNSSNYLGGAHGSSSQQYFNFDLESKKLVPLTEILEKDQLPKLEKQAYEAFKIWIVESELSTDVNEYEQVWKFKLADNYYLGKKGLILQYGEYEIGPYIVGLPRLTIPYDQLDGIVKAKYLPQSTVVASEVQATAK